MADDRTAVESLAADLARYLDLCDRTSLEADNLPGELVEQLRQVLTSSRAGGSKRGGGGDGDDEEEEEAVRLVRSFSGRIALPEEENESL